MATLYQFSLHFTLLPQLKCLLLSLFASGGAAVQPCHHPEHRQSRGNRPWSPWTLLRSREDEPSQRAFPRPTQEYGSQGLPRHVCGYVLLSVGAGATGSRQSCTLMKMTFLLTAGGHFSRPVMVRHWGQLMETKLKWYDCQGRCSQVSAWLTFYLNVWTR